MSKIDKPKTEQETAAMREFMKRTRPVCLYENLKGKTVYSLPWHPLSKIRVLKETN